MDSRMCGAASAPNHAPKPLPGSDGEHRLQEVVGSTQRAHAFYDHQVLDYLNDAMIAFIKRQEMVFIATADSNGACDCSFRSGLIGFVTVLDAKRLMYPEYRGNGVMASLGNIMENPSIGMFFADFFESAVGLHVNGRAEIMENEVLLDDASIPQPVRDALNATEGRRAERWVRVEVEEAYIHCSKHIPLLLKLNKRIHWGTDDAKHKGGDYFNAKNSPKQQDSPPLPQRPAIYALRKIDSLRHPDPRELR